MGVGERAEEEAKGSVGVVGRGVVGCVAPGVAPGVRGWDCKLRRR